MVSASTILSRLCTRSPSLALKFHKKPIPSPISPLKSTSSSQISESTKPISRISRLSLGLSSLGGSMMPLHSAIASARLQSNLSIESQSWGLVLQGISMPF